MNSSIEDIFNFLENAGDSDVPAKEILSRLEAINLRKIGHRHHEKYSQLLDGLSSCRNIQSLSDFLCKYLYSVLNQENALTIVSFCSEEHADFNTESVFGSSFLLEQMQHLINQGQLSFRMKINVDNMSVLYENRMVRIQSLYRFVHKSIPEEVCVDLEKSMDLHHFYGYPVSDGKNLIGTVSIAAGAELHETGFTEIERIIRFARQIMILMYKYQRCDQLSQQMSSIFDIADFSFGLFSSDGHLIKPNAVFSSLFGPLGSFTLFDEKFLNEVGVTHPEALMAGNVEMLDVTEIRSELLPDLREYSHGRITPVKTTDSSVSFYLFFLHSRKAELRLRETMQISEQKYQRIFNHIQDVYFETALDGTILEVSPSIQRYLDMKTNNPIGSNILSFYNNPDERAEYLNEIKKYGRVDNFELEIILPGNVILNTLVTSSIVDAGTPNERIAGSIVDITELKKKTQEIFDSESKFRSIFDNAPIGFLISNNSGEILEMNNAFLRIFGHKTIDRSKQTNIFLNENANILGISKIAAEVLYSGVPAFFEADYPLPDGSTHCFKLKISNIPGEDGKTRYLLIIVEDITDLKVKEAELEQTRERFLDIYNNTSDLIYTMDFEGNFTSVNPVAEKWLGYKFQDLKNRNMREFISHDSFNRAAEQIKLKLGHSSDHSTYEVTAYTRNKEKMILEINSYLRYKDGNPIEVFGIARDITERKKHEEFITLALRERERLIKEVHHRVKNNLQMIVSMLKMYAAGSDSEMAKQPFRDIIQKILAISAAHEDFYFSADFKDIDFRKYIETVVVNSIEQFDSNSLVKYHIEAESMNATIDEVIPLGLILSELLSNSIRYGSSVNGLVNLFISFKMSGGKHELIVSDEGPGIPGELIKNLEQFNGLSLVAMMAENQLGGSYKIDSSAKGTTVKVVF